MAGLPWLGWDECGMLRAVQLDGVLYKAIPASDRASGTKTDRKSAHSCASQMARVVNMEWRLLRSSKSREQEALSRSPVNNLFTIVCAMVDTGIVLARWVRAVGGDGPILLGQGGNRVSENPCSLMSLCGTTWSTSAQTSPSKQSS